MILKINNRIQISTIQFFNDDSVDLRHDSIASTFAFGIYFDPNNPDHKELMEVSHFHEAILEHNGETVITGYILSQSFTSSAQATLAHVSGYSKCGVLEDSNIVPGVFNDANISGGIGNGTLQFDGLTLQQIAQKLIGAFNIKMKVSPLVQPQMNIAYGQTTAHVSQTIKDYLTELAAQRNIVISHDRNGNLLFTRAPVKQTPIFHVENGVIATSIHMAFNGQALHSSITAMKQADSDGAGGSSPVTVQNPYVPIVFRPKVIVQSAGGDNDTQEVAMNALAAELKSGIVLTITTNTWVVNGKLIRPGQVISVLSPENYIYKTANFFIEAVSFKGDSKAETTTLTCVLPEVYNGQMPKNIFTN